VPFLKPLSSYNHVKKCSPVSGVQSSLIYFVWGVHIFLMVGAIHLAHYSFKRINPTHSFANPFFVSFVALISIFTFIAFFKFEIRALALMLLVSLLGSLYLSEYYLVINPVDKRFWNNNLATRLEVIENLRTKEVRVFPTTYPNMFYLKPIVTQTGKRIAPVGSISKAKLVFCSEDGSVMVFNSDRYGFHNPDSAWDQPEIDLALVGDSFVEGACLPSEFNITSRISAMTGLKTLNLGAGGGAPLVYLAAIREYLHGRKIKI